MAGKYGTETWDRLGSVAATRPFPWRPHLATELPTLTHNSNFLHRFTRIRVASKAVFYVRGMDVNYSLVYNDVRERENTHVYSHLAYDTDMRETLNVNKWEINFHIEKRKRKRILPSPNFS